MTVFLSKRNNQFKMSLTTATPSKSVTLSLLSSNDATIYWGDGSFELISQNTESYAMVHIYATANTYNVVIDKPHRMLKFSIVTDYNIIIEAGEIGKLKNLETLILQRQDEVHMASGEIRNLKNLKNLDIDRPTTSLTSYDVNIENGDLTFLPDLESIYLDGIENVSISATDWDSLLNLSSIILINLPNLLVSGGSLENTSNLAIMYFQNIGSLELTELDFSGKEDLTEIAIYNCSLTEQQIDDILGYVYNNRMSYIHPDYIDLNDIGYFDPPEKYNSYPSAAGLAIWDILQNDPLDEGFNVWGGWVNEA